MLDCTNLMHPFQNDPGTSQRQRIIDGLVSDPVKIDGRSLADLLDYFMQLSRHINFYDTDLSISDWQVFFKKSVPFSLAAIIRFDDQATNDKLDLYNAFFDKHPSKQGLQLLVHYVYYQLINRLNSWYLQVKGSGLPVELVLEKLIKDKLHDPVRQFIMYTNTAVKWYCIKPVDWNRLYDSGVWGLEIEALYAQDESFKNQGTTQRKKLSALRDAIIALAPSFINVVQVTANSATLSMEQSLLPLKEELQKNHAPHLALIFAFLKLFQYLQDDLNTFTKKHLDFFYQQVLQLKTHNATPDKAHIVFEIQKQLDSYRLQKGLLVKDGKDANKAEILFDLDDEIVVNKAQVADKRTLFLNYQTLDDTTYTEGVYMAPDASKADGIEKDFKEGNTVSFATLGAKNSKYFDPEGKFIKPYPNARLGFVLASPVLLLNEGKRTITTQLACELSPNLCDELKIPVGPGASTCCDDTRGGENENAPEFIQYPGFAPAADFYTAMANLLGESFYYVSKSLIAQAKKKGFAASVIEKLTAFITNKQKICYCETDQPKYEAIVPAAAFELRLANDLKALSELFRRRKVLHVAFSGANEWLEPSAPDDIQITPVPLVGNKFMLTIKSTFEADKPAIGFFDPGKLKEELGTTLPVAKIELDDKIKLVRTIVPRENACCLDKPAQGELDLSPYHFFRNVTVIKKIGNNAGNHDDETRISVAVCGLKNLIVQNDESVQDVNGPVYPFGTRPKVGASFYIGSKEIFAKNWQQVYVNTEWKDKPDDFGIHYKHYSYKNTTFEDGSKEIVNSSFLTTSYILDKGQWKANGQRRLFKQIPGEQVRTKPLPPGFPPVPVTPEIAAPFCAHPPIPDNKDMYDYDVVQFPGLSAYERKKDLVQPLEPFNVASRYGFLRFVLEGVSFQDDIFPFVLARQMMAYAGLLSLDIIQEMVTQSKSANKIIDSMITKINSINLHVGHIQTDIGNLTGNLNTITTQLGFLQGDLNSALTNLPGNIPLAINNINHAAGHVTNIGNALTGLSGNRNAIQGELNLIVPNLTNNPAGNFDPDNANAYGLIRLGQELKTIIQFFVDNLQVDPELKDGLPSEPYTPVIKSLTLDYTATAEISDIDLIHLYPYKDTYKPEQIDRQPSLLPTFCDEGTLFLGLSGLIPGSNVNILFQLAEATADSETDKPELHWYYLDNNQWKLLRNGFEVLDDATNGLTTSGILKFALPENMTNDNTVLPKGLHWIKVGIPSGSRSVSETIGIHAQAIQAVFTNEPSNDKLRLDKGLPAGSLSKLKEADAAVTKVTQSYDSFGGRLPEAQGHYYVRVSELLRHKGRAIQKFDYERLALEAFPQLFKVKCINHSFALDAHQYFNDMPFAPATYCWP